MDLKEECLANIDPFNHWYYISKASALIKLIRGCASPASILDVGAGSGFFSRYLVKKNMATDVTCVDINYCEDTTVTSNGVDINYCRNIESTNANLFLFMDVLEHVDDDVGFLSDYVNLAAEGSVFLISVPAHQFLWSGHDIFLEHKRRYSISEIRNLAAKAGLVIDTCCYFYCLIFPLVYFSRKYHNFFGGDGAVKSDLSKLPSFINSILFKICASEIFFFKFNKMFGTTIFCLARKNNLAH